MSSEGRSTPISATELLKQLAADPEYQARVREAAESRAAAAAELSSAEQPIIADLNATGVLVHSVWDLATEG